MPFDEDDDLLTGLESPQKRHRRPSNPLSKVLDIARADNIPDDIANDFTRLIKFESGASHYDRRGKVKLSPPDPRTGERAVGAVQIKPSTAREVGISNPFDEDENIRAGLRYFAAGGDDPVARRIRYFGGPGAQKQYQRTGRIPKGGDVLGTSFDDYVRNTIGSRPQRPSPKRSAGQDDLVTGLSPETDDDLLTGLQGQIPPQQTEITPRTARQSATRPQKSVPVRTRPVRPSRPKTLAEMATGGVGVVAAPGVGDLRRIDDPETQRITRIQRQVTSEQTPAEREMRRAPGTQNARLFDPKLTENEEVLRRLSDEQEAIKREREATAERQRIMSKFTEGDKAEIADFVNHLKGKGSTYTGIRTGARSVGASALYKLAGLTDLVGPSRVYGGKPEDNPLGEFLRRKALAGELSVDDIPPEQRGQVAEFLTQMGLGLAEIVVTPGGPVTKFAGLAGTESIGRGQSVKEVAKETAKGATVGAVFKAAPMLNKPAQTVRGRAANLAREGAGIGAGTYAVERGFGTPVDEAALSAATNVALLGVLGARRLRGRKQDAGEAEAQRQGVQTEQPVEAVEGQPVVSKAEAPQKYQHLQFGEVTAAENQTGVSKGHVRVVDQAGAEHVIQRPNLRGAGNQQAVPIKERIEDVGLQERDVLRQPELQRLQEPSVEQPIPSERLRSEAGGREEGIRTVEAPTETQRQGLAREDVGEVIPPVVEQAERRRIQREFDKIRESETTPVEPAREEVIQPSIQSPIKEVKNVTQEAEVKTESQPPIKSFDVERLGAGAQGTLERGGAPAPVEAARIREPELSSTAAKREKITADRAARGEEPLPEPLVTRKSDVRLLADAKEANTKDPNEPLRLIDQVRNGKKGALSDKETVQVDLHVQELKNKYDAVNKRLAEAKDPATIKELSEQSDAMEREMRSAEEAFAVSGTEKGRALRAQRIEIDQDFRLLTMISRATKAHGRELTRDERATIKQQHDKIAELEAKLTEVNERAAKLEAERAVGKIKSDVAKENRRAGRRVKRESLDQEAAELKSLIAQAWKRQSGGGSEIHSAMGLAKLDPEGEVTKLVVQLAKNRIQAKVGLKAEALVDEVHGLLKDVVDLNRREVAEMISGYGKTYELSKDAVDVRLRELKSIIAANLGKADIIEKGIRPLRRGLQRDKPTQEVRAAMRELRDTLREHGMKIERSKGSPEEQQQSALDAAKTRTKNRIEDLSKWIKDGKRTVANKTEIIPDAELRALQAERDRLQKVFEAIVDPAADLKKIENSLRSVNKSVADLEAKIRSGNIAAKPREKGLTSPELEAARAEQKALRAIISDLRKAAKPQPTTPEIEAKRLLSANKALTTRMEKQIADLGRRMKQGDFSKPEKREPVPFSRENLALQKQLEQVKQAYARANYKATRSRFGQISDELAKAANVPKTLKSMGDISAVFRQGGYYSITHPVEGFAKPTAAMLRSFTETGFRNVEQAIKNHPKFEQARRDGVEFTGVEKNDPNLSKMEESFFGSETIDVLARGKYNPLRAVKASKDFSQRTFVSFLDSQRMNMYDVMTDGLKAQGLTPRNDPASYKGIAKLINIGTGRGNLGKTGNQAAPLLNIAMFSPRLVASRVQLLNNMFNPVAIARQPKGVRAQNIKDNVKFLAATAAFMGLATAAGGTVNRDPDDADFLKIRFGNTTYDTLTGLQQPLRYIINMSRAATMGETYPGQGKAEMTKKFARSKASPSISPIINWVADEDFMGRKFSLKREAGEIVLPLPAKDFWEAMEKEGLVKGFLKATPALTGIGVQTYEQPPEKPKTAAEKLARKFVRDRIPDVARDEEEIERSEKKAQLRSRARKGEDVTAEVEALGIPERQQKTILDAKGMTRLQEDFKRLGLKEALAVYSVMTRGEQQQVKDILATKAMTVDNLPDDEQSRMNKRLESIGLTPPPRSQRKRPQRPSRPSRGKREGYQWSSP